MACRRALFASQAYSQLHGQQTEQRSELDDRVESNRGSVFERITYRVAYYRCVMQGRALLLELDFHDFLGVVPCAAGVSHEDGLIEAEDCDGDQIADEEERLHKSKSQRSEEHSQEDVEHTFLRVLGADFDHFLAVFDGGFLYALKLDVGLDEFHCAICARGDSLRGSAGEPVNNCAAGDQTEHKRSMQQ